ncbi:MAG: hypothetical protein FWF95_04730 [Syntrophorhabdaceae bacterium]|nr:hypothetical protein [Syntrophorhabdaceae bacterium]
MKKYVRNVNPCAFLLVLCCFLLFGGCMNAAKQNPYATSQQAMKTGAMNVNDLSGVWFCKVDTGSKVEISFNGDKYNIKIDGVDNNRGTFSIQEVGNNKYITFNINEKFDEKIDWKRQHILFSLDGGNLVLNGRSYKGTYKKILK